MESNVSQSQWLLLVLVLVLGLASWLRSKWSFSSKSLPPGPYNLPLVGWLPFLGKLPYLTLHHLSQRYGDIIYLKLGSLPFVVVSSEQSAMEMFKFHSLEVASKAPVVAGNYFGNGMIFSEYTDELKLHRKIVNSHLLSPSRLKTYNLIRKEEQLDLVRSILSHAESSEGVHLRHTFKEANLNIITYMLFGKRFYGPGAGSATDRKNFLDVISTAVRLVIEFNVSDFIPAVRWLDLQGLEKQYKEVTAKVNTYLRSILEDRRKHPRSSSGPGPVPFIDVLLSLDSTEDEISDSAKLSLLFDLLLGAIDTSAIALEWAFAHLTRHPSKLQKARDEVDKVVGKNRLVDESDLESLPYIRAVAKEALRINPPAPLTLPKVLRAPLKLREHVIPEGTYVHVNFYSIGMNECSWKNPMEFRPERFMEAEVDVIGQDYRLLPFGSGRRVCPGAKLAFEAMQFGIATIIQGFEWKVEGLEDPAELNMDATYDDLSHKAEPLVVIPKPRLAISSLMCF